MRDTCRVALGELDAFVKQGVLLVRHTLSPRGRDVGLRVDRSVLFIHGLFAGGPVFAPLRARVEQAYEIPTHDHSYLPHQRLEEVVASLSEKLGRIVETGARVSLVGHSLGGVLARVLVQERGFSPHVDRIITLATPHAGTRRARRLPGGLLAAIEPKSAVLTRLRSSTSTLENIRCVAIAAGSDVMIEPKQSAIDWPGAQTHWVDGVGHNAILFDPRVQALVLEALRDD